MQDKISKTRPILLTVDQDKTHESYFEELRSEDVIVKIVPETLTEPMEIIIRHISKPVSMEGRTGPYIPPKPEKEKKQAKGHIGNKIIDKLL